MRRPSWRGGAGQLPPQHMRVPCVRDGGGGSGRGSNVGLQGALGMIGWVANGGGCGNQTRARARTVTCSSGSWVIKEGNRCPGGRTRGCSS